MITKKVVLVAVAVAALSTLAVKILVSKGNEAMLPFKAGPSYSNDWRIADSLYRAGLPVEALKKVDAIRENAISHNNYAQLIKTLIYNEALKNQNKEQKQEIIIAEIEKETAEASYPVKPVLQSMLAQLYWSYYENNRYKIAERTQLTGIPGPDISTWDATAFSKRSGALYLESLSQSDSLQHTDLAVFNDVLLIAPASKNFRPTLYDFLAPRAIGFFADAEVGVADPADKFVMNDAHYLGSTADFLKIRINSSDTFSLLPRALKIMQDLARFNSERGNINALVDEELNRLNFSLEHIVNEQKDSLHLAALMQLEQQYANDTISALTGFEIAEKLNYLGSKYVPEKDSAYRWLKQQALEKCTDIGKRFPYTTGAVNCRALSARILTPQFSFRSENVDVPDKPFKLLFSYTNVDSIHLRIVNAENIDQEAIEGMSYEDMYRVVSAAPEIKRWASALPACADHQEHKTELPVTPLKKGTYYVLASTSAKFDINNASVSVTRIQVSDLGYISRHVRGENEFWINDRTTGKAVAGAIVKVYVRKYDSDIRKYVKSLRATYTSDANGTVMDKGGKEYEQLDLQISYKDDRLASGDNDNWYNDNTDDKDEDWEEHVVFFTDRGIYRPGQTLHFKGLCLKTKNGQNKIEKGVRKVVELDDANDQKVAELNLTSNEFGTFAGTFTLPSTGLNGIMRLSTDDDESEKRFRVEDYKRPQFEVSYEPIKGSFRLGDKVSVTGKVTSYSGTPVDGAMVLYHVNRRATFPYWFSWEPTPTSNSQEIVTEKIQTDENGEFRVNFTALPDASVKPLSLPEYTYSVSADVTDINGETQSANTHVTIGYVALQAKLELSVSYSTKDTQSVKIETQNLNGEFEAAKGTIQIFKLKENERITRSRPWEKPDQQTMTEADYHQNFPLDIYQDEDRVELWPKAAKVFYLAFDSEHDKTFHLKGLGNWGQGEYLAELTTHDKFGVEVKTKNYFTVYDPGKKEMPLKNLWWMQKVKTEVEPGQVAKVWIGSSEKDVTVLYEVALKGAVIHHELIKLNNEKRLVELPVTEDYRGNVMMSFRMAKDERVFKEELAVVVPYTNKELKMEFATFRDKLTPGCKEQWKVKITGLKGEKVAAEMLAEMYDASLDAFARNPYSLDLYPERFDYTNSPGQWQTGYLYEAGNAWEITNQTRPGYHYYYQHYDQLNWFIIPINTGRYGYLREEGDDYTDYTYKWGDTNTGAYEMDARPTVKFVEMSVKKEKNLDEVTESVSASMATQSPGVYDIRGNIASVAVIDGQISGPNEAPAPRIVPRSNFTETAFFYPQLQTDSAGNIVFSFTVPDALTRWKFQGIAHTQDLKLGFITASAVSQKDLMITPNAPRFLREGDEIEFTAKISSLSDKDLNGKAQLSFTDPYTNKDITALFGAGITSAAFNVKAGKSAAVAWKLKVPEGLGAVSYRVTASAGNFTDGEEAALPVLSNRMLVTETMPVHVKGGGQKTFTMEKLVNSASSKTLTNHKLTFELTSNPVWYAVQALPYMMEFPHECSEQLFNRFYANSMATYIANSSPRMQQVFNSWKGGNALVSNLEKNKDLKQILLEESPWVLQGRDETERKKRLGLLFDLNKMSSEEAMAIKKLADNQSSNGGWPWFKGMPDNRYITQYVVTGLGRLQNLGIIDIKKNYSLNNAANAAIRYLDKRIAEDYNDLLRYGVNLNEQHVSEFEIQYLYARSYFSSQTIPVTSRTAYDYYYAQAKKYWQSQSKYGEAMVAIILYRKGDVEASNNILRSLKETATINEEMGMYWIDNVAGYSCFEAPVETQALMIEAFSLTGKDESVVDDLRTWLLKQKQVRDWKTTKATSDACYALLLNGTDWLSTTEIPDVTIGGTHLSALPNLPKAETGTGYLQTSWEGKDVKPEMGKVSISKQTKGIAWGALYWQYFEQLDKITRAKTPLQLDKKLFLKTNGPTGPVLTLIDNNTSLKTGDLITVRIELRVDREMDFVQMKDMRASGFEPTSVLSAYKYQGGLGYYESTRDASTNFFFDYLPKGTFVFEYTLRVSQKGDFSNGITTIQSMYAPEFSSHSEGVRVLVK